MYSEVNLTEILRALKTHWGNVDRAAHKIGVNERTLRSWNKKTEAELHHLRSENIEQIIRAARDSNIEVEMFAPPPLLWNGGISYEENLLADPGLPPHQSVPFRHHQIPFLGYVVNSRFGASASVMTSSCARIQFLLASGADTVVYKTVRSEECGPHPGTNIMFCSQNTQRLRPESTLPRVIVGDRSDSYHPRFGIMNRFGMPSAAKEVWQADFRAAKATLNTGQLLILSVVPTAKRDDPESTLIKDSVRVIEYALAAGAEVIELNCSCPNCNGMEGELYRNLKLMERVCKAVNEVIGHVKLILKIGYLNDKDLSEFVGKTAPYVHGYSAINSLPIEGQRNGQNGPEPAFGKPRLRAGLSGAPILRFGLRCVQSLATIREREKLKGLAIIGVGGVMTPGDVQSYINSGADIVQSASAFFNDSYFGIKVRKSLDSQLVREEFTVDEEREFARVNWSRAVEELEKEFGRSQNIRSTIELAALRDFQEWDHNQSATIALGPRRKVPVPSAADFKTRIKDRLRETER